MQKEKKRKINKINLLFMVLCSHSALMMDGRISSKVTGISSGNVKI